MYLFSEHTSCTEAKGNRPPPWGKNHSSVAEDKLCVLRVAGSALSISSELKGRMRPQGAIDNMEGWIPSSYILFPPCSVGSLSLYSTTSQFHLTIALFRHSHWFTAQRTQQGGQPDTPRGFPCCSRPPLVSRDLPPLDREAPSNSHG